MRERLEWCILKLKQTAAVEVIPGGSPHSGFPALDDLIQKAAGVLKLALPNQRLGPLRQFAVIRLGFEPVEKLLIFPGPNFRLFDLVGEKIFKVKQLIKAC